MSRPKFWVSEEVLCYSYNQSPGNFIETTITNIYFKPFPWRAKEGLVTHPAGFCYEFTNNCCAPEINLRKKHKPSDQSFDEMMSSLKKGVSVFIGELK